MISINEKYKKYHKPLQEGKTHFHQGYFIPTLHPEKCLTKENIYRSSWEQKFFDWCDRCDAVVRWASEPVKVEYLNPVTNIEYCKKNNLDPKNPVYWKKANYYVDAWIEIKKKDDDSIRKIFIEIKPYAETQKPKPVSPNASLKEIKAFNRAAMTYLVNQAKWKAADAEFKKRNCEFMVVTEKTLKKLKIINY